MLRPRKSRRPLLRLASNNSLNDSPYGSRATPRSVMMAFTYFAGVTSNAGFSIDTPSGVICFPAMCVIAVWGKGPADARTIRGQNRRTGASEIRLGFHSSRSLS